MSFIVATLAFKLHLITTNNLFIAITYKVILNLLHELAQPTFLLNKTWQEIRFLVYHCYKAYINPYSDCLRNFYGAELHSPLFTQNLLLSVSSFITSFDG